MSHEVGRAASPGLHDFKPISFLPEVTLLNLALSHSGLSVVLADQIIYRGRPPT
jgi:hypothetical protein